MSVRLFFALLDMVAVLFIWYQTFPKAGNRILHCAVSCVFGAVIVYSLRSTPRALDILCLAVSWELMEKYIKSRDIRFLFVFSIPRDFYSQSARCALALRDHVAACRFIR